jgi:hypothetical protein
MILSALYRLLLSVVELGGLMVLGIVIWVASSVAILLFWFLRSSLMRFRAQRRDVATRRKNRWWNTTD